MNVDDEIGQDASSSDDLRSAIESAVREAPPENTRTESQDAPAERQAIEPQRDEGGRFAPKAAEQAQPKGLKEQPQQPATEGTATAATTRAPASWSQDTQPLFGSLPPAIQDQILKREADVAKGMQKNAERARIADEWDRVSQPYADVFRHHGMSPHQAAERLFAVEQQLQRDPAGTIAKIAQAYNVNLAGSPQHAAPQQRQPVPQQPAVPIDRIVDERVQSALQRQATQGEIQQFTADPANVHFDTLRPTMLMLLQTGKANSLREAYDAAAWLEPTIRDQLIAQRTAPADAQARAAKDQAAVARAKLAAGSVKGSPGGTSPQQAERSLRDELAARFR